MKKVFSVFGILVGVLSIILAIVCFSQYVGGHASSKSYGGDAYTGIQNAAAQAANNTRDLASVTRCVGGSILLVLGLLTITYFAMKLFDDIKGNIKIGSNNVLTPSSASVVKDVFSQQSINNNGITESNDSQSILKETNENEP